MTGSVLLAQVAVPVPLTKAFTYAVPASMVPKLVAGMRVTCRFHGRPVLGVVLGVEEGEPPTQFDLLPLGEIVDDLPTVPSELLRFLVDLSSYYLAPIGEVVRAALPALERQRARDLQQRGLLDKSGREVGGRLIQVAHATSLSSEGMQLRAGPLAVLAHLRANGPSPIARLAQHLPNARRSIRKLASLGLVSVEERELPNDPFFREPVERDVPPEPTAAQAEAIAAISDAIERPHPHGYLLHGVTGSGKTEVYLRAIEVCLRRQTGALVLVPEIALTPQLVSRFRARFGDGVAVLHSGLGDRARFDMWTKLRHGGVRVAIGARSAIFAPVPALGLVIVDEEHDSSFKQEEGVRYHARDMALLRAHRAGATCVLGSATPSLESEALVQQGKLTRLLLPARATMASLPEVELVDLRRTAAGPSGHSLLSIPLHRAIERAIAAGEQAILFLNRRGFAPSVQCEGCGDIIRCPLCSVSTTLHRGAGMRLRCHYCDYEAPLPRTCPACGCERLALLGLGTERLEEMLAQCFPTARVARLDRDVAPGAKSEAIINRMRRKEADILVGTQMVTKGHDLPDVTVVGVVNADASLSLPDFRAAERTFQLLVQVAGRAGRASRPGRVIIQTRIPEHVVLQHALRHDVESFVEAELKNRKEAGYPPFTRLALVRLDAADERRVRAEANRLAQVARQQDLAAQVDVLGPSPAPIERIRGRYRFRILIRSVSRPALRSVARAVARARDPSNRLVRVSVDIDPMQML